MNPIVLPLRRQCSWCGKVLAVGAAGAATTHGVCQSCAEKVRRAAAGNGNDYASALGTLSEIGHARANGNVALTLALRLRDELQSGRTQKYQYARSAEIRALPDEVCYLCHGTGRRTDMVVAHGCNKCKGEGRVRPDATWYWFDTETVDQFAAFLERCGGCTID